MSVESGTYAISWPFSKRKICVGLPRAFILLRESLGIESCRIGIVIRVVVEAVNRYDDPHAGRQLHIAVRYLILVLAFSREQRGRRIFPEGLYRIL